MSFNQDLINNLKFQKDFEETVLESFNEIIVEIKGIFETNEELGISLVKINFMDRNEYGFELNSRTQDKITVKVTTIEVLKRLLKITHRLPEVVNKEAVKNNIKDIILDKTSALRNI